MSEQATDKQQSRLLRPVTLRQIVRVSPALTRVVLAGETVRAFAAALPGAWLKLFFTPPDSPEGPGRAYTLSALDVEALTLSLDIVHHAQGAAMRWLQQAHVGDVVRIAGPRDGLETRGITSLLLFGDETALPAISAIAAALPPSARAKVLLNMPADTDYPLAASQCALTVDFVPATDSTLAQQVVVAQHGFAMIWGAGEHGEVIPIRQALLAGGRHRKSLNITAYWKQGEADHRDDFVLFR